MPKTRYACIYQRKHDLFFHAIPLSLSLLLLLIIFAIKRPLSIRSVPICFCFSSRPIFYAMCCSGSFCTLHHFPTLLQQLFQFREDSFPTDGSVNWTLEIGLPFLVWFFFLCFPLLLSDESTNHAKSSVKQGMRHHLIITTRLTASVTHTKNA